MYSIGIDIGGMSAKVGVVEDSRLPQSPMLQATYTIPTNHRTEYEVFLSDICHVIERIISESGKVNLKMIGISSFGLIDTHKGKIIFSNNVNWENVNIVSDISSRFQVPVKIANDAKCALLAEAVIGSGKDYDRVCMLTIGTGVGGGFLTGKKLDGGTPHSDAAGILGHMSMITGGKQCTCGRRGCLEAYASSTAIMSLYKEKTGQEISTKEIFERIRMGEKEATEVGLEFRYYLGEGLVNIANILRPEVIVIGGGVSKSADVFMEYLQERVNREAYAGAAVPVQITVATLGNEAGMIGATLL